MIFTTEFLVVQALTLSAGEDGWAMSRLCLLPLVFEGFQLAAFLAGFSASPHTSKWNHWAFACLFLKKSVPLSESHRWQTSDSWINNLKIHPARLLAASSERNASCSSGTLLSSGRRGTRGHLGKMKQVSISHLFFDLQTWEHSVRSSVIHAMATHLLVHTELILCFFSRFLIDQQQRVAHSSRLPHSLKRNGWTCRQPLCCCKTSVLREFIWWRAWEIAQIP